MEIICIHLKENTIEYFQASNPSNTPNTQWCRYVRFTGGANWVGMATGRVWDGSPLSHSRPKIFGYFPSRPKPEAGRGMQSHPCYKVKIKIPSPARPDAGMCCHGGGEAGLELLMKPNSCKISFFKWHQVRLLC